MGARDQRDRRRVSSVDRYVDGANLRALTDAYLCRCDCTATSVRCDARNVRSQRVAERAGYPLEATLRNHAVAADGKLRDTLIFARLEPPESR